MTDGKLWTYRKYNYLIRTMVIYGCCHTYAVFNGFTYFLTGLTMFGFMIQTFNYLRTGYQNRYDLAILMKVVGRFTTTTGVILKISCLLLNRKYVTKFDRSMQNFFEEELARNDETKTVMLSNINNFFIPACIYPVVMLSTIMLYVGPVLYNLIRQLIHLQIPTRYGLPFRTMYWWSVPDGIVYHLHFVYEMYSIWFLMFVTCGVDTLFGFYAYQISAVLRAMAFRLTNPMYEENVSDLLRTSIEKHKELLKCRQYLEHFYGPIIIWPVLTNAVIMCALVYEALPISDMTIGKFMMLFFYMGMKVIQTFMYTWYGTSITSASEDFRQGIYCSMWPDAIAERHLRTTMVMTLMQESMSMRAMKICPVSVQTFSAVLNTTISYFFLLQTVQER